ncbi:MAG: hypothetical protein E7521_06005 [Ruminococcaceae bacterium]|nr:hypothetical protein [Oscillospiraceae bacterium]
MADYKRKKVKKSFTKKKPQEINNDIQMRPKNKKNIESIVPQEDIKVVRGSKYGRSFRNKFLITVVAVVAIVYFVLSLILPVSVYENITNSIALLGHGKYPTYTSGSTIINSVSNGQYYYVLTDTSIIAYSNGGKIIFNELHGFSNPVLSVSETRAIVYDQGGENLYVYNLSGKIDSLDTKQEIITASISRNGDFAVSTHSDNYTSVVKVYDKNLENIYTWNSAKDIVNNVLVNNSGNRLAVTTFNAIAGQYNSKMIILGFESADPLYTVELESTVALSLFNTGKGVSVITPNKYKFINWKKFTINDIDISGEINLVRKAENGLLLVTNRANDRSDNTVLLVSKKGLLSKEFKINNLITDIQYSKSRVYYISDTLVNILDNNGNVLRYGDCVYGTQKISVLSSNSVAVITDSEIFKTNIEKGVD